MTLKVKPQLALLRAQWGKITQSELSRQTGITQKQLSALETGKTKAIAFETLAKLCEFFSCTPNDLLELEPEKDANSPPTKEELLLADEIISRGISHALEATKRPAEEIWAEFDAVRARIVAHSLVQTERESNARGD